MALYKCCIIIIIILLLWKLGLWSLEARRNRSDLIEVYKMLNGKSAVNFSRFFRVGGRLSYSWTLIQIKERRNNTDLRQHFFSERIVNIWNSLDDDLVCSSSLNVLKMDFIHYGRMTDCRWVSYSLLTYDPQRLSQSPW